MCPTTLHRSRQSSGFNALFSETISVNYYYRTYLKTQTLTMTILIVSMLCSRNSAENLPQCVQPPYEHEYIIKLVPDDKVQVMELGLLLNNVCHFFLLQPEFLNIAQPALIITDPNNILILKQVSKDIDIVTRDIPQFLQYFPKQNTVDHGYLGNQTNENENNRISPSFNDSVNNMHRDWFYHGFQSLNVLYSRWYNISITHPDSVRLEVAGTSIEGRPIYVLRIGHTNPKAPRRLVVNALLHAREWVVALVATYFAERLAATKHKLLIGVEVLVVPVANPDGYEFTRTGDRFWRKNRLTFPFQPPYCSGVDLNRNWPLDFLGPYGSSNDPCSDVYAGDEPFSEPETVAMKSLIVLPGVKAHLDLHSYGCLIIGPYAYSYTDPPNLEDVVQVGKEIARRISNGFNETYSFSYGGDNELYPASGIMMDWVHSRGALSFTAEVRPGRGLFGTPGFLLPEQDILPTCIEMYEGIGVLLEYTGKDLDEEEIKQWLEDISPTPATEDPNSSGSITISPSRLLPISQTILIVILTVFVSTAIVSIWAYCFVMQ